MAGPEQRQEPQTETTGSRMRLLGNDLIRYFNDYYSQVIGDSPRSQQSDLTLQQSIVMQAVSQAIENLEEIPNLDTAPGDQVLEMALLEETNSILQQWNRQLEAGRSPGQLMEDINLSSNVLPNRHTFERALGTVSEETSRRRVDSAHEWFRDRARNNLHTSSFGELPVINGIIDAAADYAYRHTVNQISDRRLDSGDTLQLRGRFSELAENFIEDIIFYESDEYQNDRRLPEPTATNMSLYSHAFLGISGAENESGSFLNERSREATLDLIRQDILHSVAETISRRYVHTMDSPESVEIYNQISEYVGYAVESLESSETSLQNRNQARATIRRDALSQMISDLENGRRRLRSGRARRPENVQDSLEIMEAAIRVLRNTR
jgi:hypothetical protein